jgi:hypothetical protein
MTADTMICIVGVVLVLAVCWELFGREARCRFWGHKPVWYYDGSGHCRRCGKSGDRPCRNDWDGFGPYPGDDK